MSVEGFGGSEFGDLRVWDSGIKGSGFECSGFRVETYRFTFREKYRRRVDKCRFGLTTVGWWRLASSHLFFSSK